MIVYASRTGNVRYVTQTLQLPNIEMNEVQQLTTPFLLFTYTDGLGDIPVRVEQFMKQHYKLCRGIIVSGNSNFGHQVFGQAGDKLAALYNIPLVCKLDLRGTAKDYAAIQAFYYEHIQEGQHEAVFEIK
ncbi:class Ib ribonucleoside-diphosphate reductase assembly flavoprotein NrdI [Lysinibacillus sp. KU-BSD001]|uniref:class Ib ribonucleoside-diphosphate reductase assembly flavoprotein NrdI n=1 Tax=Lysinibacillus sp. KU-BSD001 TaxID=3141328 RepID=UPI0036EB9E94